MAAHIGQPTRSRRFIKVYLLTWAMLAVGAVAYLAFLAFPPDAATPPPVEVADRDPAKTAVQGTNGTNGGNKAMAEVRGSLTEIRKEVTQLQDAMGERVANEKSSQSRLTALEERVAGI